MLDCGFSIQWFWSATARRVVSLLITALIVAFDPLGLANYTDLLSRDIWYRIASPFYPKEASEQITVVLLDDNTVSSGEMSYPPTFDHYAALLKIIAGYKPKAIFFDFLFLDERGNAHQLELFERYIERAKRSKIPVFLANPRRTTSPLPTSSNAAQPNEQTCLNRTIHLLGRLEQVASELPFVQSATRPNPGFYNLYGFEPCSGEILPSPAMSMYLVACRENEGTCPQFDDPLAGPVDHSMLQDRFDKSMSVRWGDSTSTLNRQLYPMDMNGLTTPQASNGSDTCTPPVENWWSQLIRAGSYLLTGVFQGLQNEQHCLYHTHIPLWSVLKRQNLLSSQHALEPDMHARLSAQQRATFQGKYVFIGGDLTGIPDHVPTPTQGKIPGVAFHAMALDNLLTLGDGYNREAQTYFWELDINGVIEICLLALFMFVEVGYLRCKDLHILKLKNNSCTLPKVCHLVSLTRHPLLQAMIWLGGMTLFVLFLETALFAFSDNEPLNWLGVLIELFLLWGILAPEILNTTKSIDQQTDETEKET